MPHHFELDLEPRSGNRPQLRDEVESHLRQLIISGRAQRGEMLRLDPLAKELGVSITPVREALLLLTYDGWVVQEKNRGFCVASVRRQDVTDAYLVNAFASSRLAKRATETITPAAIASLRKFDEQIRTQTDAGYLETISQLNGRIHIGIYHAANSPRMLSFADSASRFVPRKFWPQVPGWVELNYNGHRPLLDALEKREADLAAERMHNHIIAAGDLLIAHLESVQLFYEDDAERSPEPA